MLKNSGYNLLGNFLPLIIGFLSIPILIRQITLERFGILTVVWAMIGYFSLFDFGFSRIITLKVSELHALKKFNEVNTTFWTLLKLILMATLAGTSLIFIASFFESFFASRASAHVIEEGIISLRIIAFTLPAITLTAGVKGALEADHQFYRLNIIQTFMGVANSLVPTLVSLATPNLASIVISLAIDMGSSGGRNGMGTPKLHRLLNLTNDGKKIDSDKGHGISS
jgi:O-antigen/teichoic acid export membrane protein